MSIAGVVLAAGRSTRMGTTKALLDFRGQPFVIRVLEALEALDLKTRVVVLGADAARVRPAIATHECLIVENPDVDAGPIASLRLALRAVEGIRPAGVLVWPVDLPHVRVSTVERLIEARARQGGAAIIPSFADRHGHPVIWDAALFEELETSAAASKAGARAVLETHRDQVTVVPVDDPAVTDDLNTPEDYERLIRELNRDIY
ncbi:MAG TPA: nucleotidyltransferase family protein [Gemmatimonadales bacterium]|nr:nucleotidyltransferase family protein [Gemmatimonadales bacterium]